jgi:CSLREA domain-containing protein
MHMPLRTAHALTPLILLFALPCAAVTFEVDTSADSVDALPGDHVCADSTHACSLRAAIQEANASSGDNTIVLPAGVYALALAGNNEDLGASGDLDIDSDLAIEGADVATSVIDGGALDRVLDLRPAPHTVQLRNLSVRNGLQGDGSPPGPTRTGAGLRVGSGVALKLSHVDIRDNHTSNAFGAVAIDNRGCIEGDHVRVIGNTDLASIGAGDAMSGGIETAGANSCLDLVDSEISDNRGDASGAIHVDEFAPVTLRRTLVANNSARFAGALELNQGSDVLLENVTISGNAGDPGAILNDGGTHLTLIGSTVTGNHASGTTTNVGGIYDVHGGSGLTFLSNTILSGNGPGFISDDCVSITSLDGGNIVGDSAHCHFVPLASDRPDVDAGLGLLADNGGFTRTHLPGANAIDHGVATACPATDQRGLTRPQDGDGDGSVVCDIGAVEIGGSEAIFADGFDGAARR